MTTKNGRRLSRQLPLHALIISTTIGSAAQGWAGTPASFTEEAVLRGLNYLQGSAPGFGHGVAFVDLDRDGDPDAVTIGATNEIVGLFENDGTGYFLYRSAGSGIPSISAASGVAAGDYDSDGDLDLYFSNYRIPNILVRNDGGFKFTDVTSTAGVGDTGSGTGSVWGDYDNDGLLDLYVANRTVHSGGTSPEPNRLYRNLGGGVFQDVAATLGVDDDSLTFQAIFFDFDLDGDADLYLSTDKCDTVGRPNRLFENLGGTFQEIGVGSGADVCIGSMGVAVGDFNGDGWPDLFCTNEPPGHKLLLNQAGNGLFTDASSSAGVEGFTLAWGAAFHDFDNDAVTDLYICNSTTTNHLFHNTTTWPTSEIGASVGVNDPGSSYGAAVADVDGDGDLDYMVQNNFDRIRLYINHEGETRNWIKFRVYGPTTNRFAIGGRLRIRIGSTWQDQEILAGGNGYKSQNDLTLHFGVDAATSVDEVVVMWPGGDTNSFFDLPTNQTHLLTVPGPPIPAASSWGISVLILLVLTAGTVVSLRREAVCKNR